MGLLSGFLLAYLVGDAYASYCDFGIPASNATVNVRVFNVANMTLLNETHAFSLPVLPGHESSTFPMYSFLVEHKSSQKRLMFDLGVRKDPENTPPAFASAFSSGFAQLEPYKDITVLLQDGGINLTSIDAVIWSHAHFDHVGDMSTFPNSTKLMIGPDTNLTTFPESPTATLQASDFAGHDITRVNFSNAKLTFSGLKAVDYFGDGSFYLVDTLGHLPGHLTALVRVTPKSFVVLGGDTFHHAGQARPRPPVPEELPLPRAPLRRIQAAPHREMPAYIGLPFQQRAEAFLSISNLTDSFYADPAKAIVSLDKVASFDADPDFFVITAHDVSLRSALPYFPAYLNGWQASKLKEKAVGNFIDTTNPAFVFSPV
ncbi:beta-lactamase-like protein [Mycena albidolilacea]|uniref:Beta-lactamase-like protein n=1 Tax=Mycena albidolilacea TaxID=1033008 RepID=A0AAD7EI00_9AGAR|nr:beta-lactamase-like protein [Mycena albidolilacea]